MIFNFFIFLLYIYLYCNKLKFVFSKGRNTGSSTVILGKYPLVKQLNNGDYIALDEKGVYIIDPFFQSVEKTIESSTFTSYNPHSANIAQFPGEYGNLIIVINHNVIYIISEEEELLEKGETDNINPNNFYSIIPFYRGSHLYFWVYDIYIFYYDSDKKLKYFDVFYSDTFNIGNPAELNLDSLESYYFNIDCLMVNKTEKIISIFSGNNDNYILSNFNFSYYRNIYLINNKSKIFSVDSVNERYIFKTRVLPGNQKAVFCSYSQDDNFDCALYNISTNSFSKYIHTNIKGSEFHEQNIYIEYFAQSKEIIIGKQINKNTISTIVCTEEFECSSNIKQTLSCIDAYISRVNIILPSNLANDNIYYANATDENDDTKYCI